MENQKALELLAQKLGTTTQYLWGILLRQAHIDATICLLQTVFIALFGFVIYRMHLHFSNDKNKMSYQEHDELGFFVCVIFIIWCILVLFAFFSINDIINGYFNPEFWALNHVLEALKK